MSTDSVDFLLDQQCADGGFRNDMDAEGCASDADATAFAAQALIAAGMGDAADDALGWLADAQLGGGALESDDGVANANTTGVAAQAFAAGGRDADLAQAQAFLVSLQYGCSSPVALRGGIAFSATTRSASSPSDSDLRATPQATLGLSGQSLLSVEWSEEASAGTTATPCTTTPTTDPSSSVDPTTTGPDERPDGRCRGVGPGDDGRRGRDRLARPDRYRSAGTGPARPGPRGRRWPGRVGLVTTSGGARLMRRPVHRLLGRLAGVAAASGLALAGLVVAASPASAAACSGTKGVTVVVDTGSSISTRCASGDPSSALKALGVAGFDVTYPQQFPGSVVCRINGYPKSDPCVRMPPGSAYWAFFHAKRGGSWVYSSNGVATYDPAPGSVVGFRFGSGQKPGIAPPAPTKTSAPAPTKTTAKPKPTTVKPTPTTAAPKATTPRSTATGPAGGATSSTPATGTATPSATATASDAASPTDTGTGGPSASASDIAAAPTSTDADDGTGPGTLVIGAALVALVAGGAGWAAWKRRV